MPRACSLGCRRYHGKTFRRQASLGAPSLEPGRRACAGRALLRRRIARGNRRSAPRIPVAAGHMNAAGFGRSRLAPGGVNAGDPPRGARFGLRVSAGQCVEHADPASDALVKGTKVVLFVRRVDLVIVESEADQHGRKTENLEEISCYRNRTPRADEGGFVGPLVRERLPGRPRRQGRRST